MTTNEHISMNGKRECRAMPMDLMKDFLAVTAAVDSGHLAQKKNNWSWAVCAAVILRHYHPHDKFSAEQFVNEAGRTGKLDRDSLEMVLPESDPKVDAADVIPGHPRFEDVLQLFHNHKVGSEVLPHVGGYFGSRSPYPQNARLRQLSQQIDNNMPVVIWIDHKQYGSFNLIDRVQLYQQKETILRILDPLKRARKDIGIFHISPKPAAWWSNIRKIP
jgi:hypothetical protein